MEKDPEYMELRPILATKNGTIYCGNMRYRAAQHLGWEDIPCALTDIPEKLAKERAVKDNSNFGEWDDTFSTLIDEIASAGIPIESLGLDPAIERALKSMDNIDPDNEWEGMPEFNQDDATAYRQIKVSFKSEEDVQKFAKLIKQDITEKTKALWYPEAQKAKNTDKRYA